MTTTANHKTYHELPRPRAVTVTTPTAALLRISSQDILKGRQEVEIEHNGMLYRFRCTSLGKLILTK
ncbi:hemin uptake protein HemP [Undibacterium danionis]|uniref:Hemin uptake protein HemP n=1 Tax=Undibacterium danionis TaxID=1812100 RepID=A0ABV6IH65_9BURK